MSITIYEIFELNRIIKHLLYQQSSYDIKIAFKFHKVIKWLDDTENFIMERMKSVFGDNVIIDTKNELHSAFLNTQLPFIETDLTINEISSPIGKVNVNIYDVEILKKFFIEEKTD